MRQLRLHTLQMMAAEAVLSGAALLMLHPIHGSEVLRSSLKATHDLLLRHFACLTENNESYASLIGFRFNVQHLPERLAHTHLSVIIF